MPTLDIQREAALKSLSANDQDLLRPIKRAKALEELASGKRMPATDDQLRFARVMRGEVEASSKYEEAFLRYRTALFLQYRQSQNAIDQSVAQQQERPKSPEGSPKSQPQEQPETSSRRRKLNSP